MSTIIERNRERDLYLLDTGKRDDGVTCHVYLIPRGWVDEFSKAAGHEWGPDATGPDDADGPEVYCYAPNGSSFETFWVPVADLEKMEEITEQRARQIEPALFETLAKINQDQG